MIVLLLDYKILKKKKNSSFLALIETLNSRILLEKMIEFIFNF